MTDKQKILLEGGTNELEVVEFFIDHKEANGKIVSISYGINVGKVREIIRVPENITEVAKTHPAIEGIYNFRGKIVSILNLPKWLNKYSEDIPLNRIIITEFNKNYYGFLVNSVSRIHRVSWEKVEPPDILMRGGKDDCVTGMIKFEDRILIMLDFERVIVDVSPKTEGITSNIVKAAKKNQGKTIMVVEDSKVVTQLVMKILHNAGYDVVSAGNGDEAYSKLERLKSIAKKRNKLCSDILHLIISDIEMPKMDGLHFLVKIKESQELKNIPVIIFSSMATKSNILKWQGLGANDLISKMDTGKLLKTIEKHIL